MRIFNEPDFNGESIVEPFTQAFWMQNILFIFGISIALNSDVELLWTTDMQTHLNY